MRCDLKGDTAYGGMWQESRFCAPSPDRRRAAIRRSAGYSSIARSGFQPAAAAHGTRSCCKGACVASKAAGNKSTAARSSLQRGQIAGKLVLLTTFSSTIEIENLICEQICQEAGESRPGWEAGAAFVLASPVVVSAVAAHDGGVRLICAGLGTAGR